MADYLEKQVQQGKAAASFLAHESWVNAVAKVKANYTKVFLESKPEQQAERDKAYLMNRVLGDLEIELKKVIDNGMHAESEVKRVIRKG